MSMKKNQCGHKTLHDKLEIEQVISQIICPTAHLGILVLLFHILNDSATLKALKGPLQELWPDLTCPGNDPHYRSQLPNLWCRQVPQPTINHVSMWNARKEARLKKDILFYQGNKTPRINQYLFNNGML